MKFLLVLCLAAVAYGSVLRPSPEDGPIVLPPNMGDFVRPIIPDINSLLNPPVVEGVEEILPEGEVSGKPIKLPEFTPVINLPEEIAPYVQIIVNIIKSEEASSAPVVEIPHFGPPAEVDQVPDFGTPTEIEEVPDFGPPAAIEETPVVVPEFQPEEPIAPLAPVIPEELDLAPDGLPWRF